jgi:hypothetical protein
MSKHVYSETMDSSLINSIETDLGNTAATLCSIRYCLLFKKVEKETDRAAIYRKLADIQVQLKLAQENLAEQME